MVEFSKHNQNGYHKALEYYGLSMAPWNSDDERLEKIGLLKYINLVVASAEEGVAKPDLRIFEIALSRADCKAEEAVMVGDRLDNDIVPANKIGMKTVWIKQGFGGFATPKSEDESPDYTIRDLRGLEDILGI